MIRRIARSPMFALLVANFIGTGVGGLYFVLARQRFSDAIMGRYGVAISLQMILAGILAGGLQTAVVRVGAGHLREGRRSSAGGVLLLALLTAVGGTLLLLAVAQLWRHHWEIEMLSESALTLVLLWTGARALFNCETAALLAEQRFLKASLLTLVSAGTGLVSLGMAMQGTLTLRRLLLAHIGGLGGAAVIGLFFVLPLWSEGVALSKRLAREMFGYAAWPTLCGGAESLQTNLAPFLVMALAGSIQTGIFATGRYPAFVFGTLAGGLYQYWLPAASLQETHQNFVRFLRRQQKVAALVGLGMVLAAIACSPIFNRLGGKWAGAAFLFILNSADFALLVLTKPVDAVYHGLRRPHLELLRRLGRLPFILGMAFLLVPREGALGMAWAQVTSSLVALLLGVWLVRRELAHLSEREAVEVPPEDAFLPEPV